MFADNNIMNYAIIIVAVLLIVYFAYRYLSGNNDNVSNPAITLNISNNGIESTEAFTTLFPALNSQYPEFTMMQPTKENIDAVNSLDAKAWELVMGLRSGCDKQYPACKSYSIKNKGQFRTHLDSYRKWLDNLDTAALTKLSGILTSSGIEYDFDNNILLMRSAGNMYVVLPITSLSTPLVDSKVITSVSDRKYPAPLNTMYTLYTTYVMIVMTMYKVMKKDIAVNFDVMWEPIDSKDYLGMLENVTSLKNLNL